ncbi:MAG: DJ-1/PfpI family protein [Deltaproteobacteria bacterium]|jgi:4-methyl-5(b-hydroxyethyl)-thiazole monophosphate biosynthesis|nr:DJ-1/PfpI family protein [Deltaproteobacteria bacterium]
MPRVALFLIDGFEETEAVTTVDLLRRGGVTVETVALADDRLVTGGHGIALQADQLFKNSAPESFDMLVIPGGTIAYLDHPPFMEAIAAAARRGQKIAAICAAPAVLGALGLLKGRAAACYPGFEERLAGAVIVKDRAVTDGNFTTSRGPATAPYFALEILKILKGADVSQKIQKDILLA